jgi:CubicO group peptidase (beta-lactamase class C family)
MTKFTSILTTRKHSALLGIIVASLFFSATSFANEQLKLSKQVDKLFDELIEPGAPGCAVGIYKNNSILYSQGYGLANIENNVPITPKSVFDIGSTSKQFTAASIVKLEQMKKLTLDDDIRLYLPEIPPYGKKITIRNLLNHTSGLRDYIGLMLMAGFDIDDVTTDDDAMSLIVRQKNLNFTPGSEHSYSNTGFFLASIIVERVSGQSLKDFARQHIFTPLKMTSTGYINSHTSLVKNRAAAYGKNEVGDYVRDVSYWEQNGDGAVFTTVEDLLLWDSIFYSKEATHSKLKNSLYEKGQLDNGEELNYALGLAHSKHKGLELIEHSGSWGGYRAQMVRIPAHNFTVSTLCNRADIHPTHMATKVFELYLAQYLVEVASAKPENKMEEESTIFHPSELADSVYQGHSGKYEILDYPGEFIELVFDDKVFSLVSNFEPKTNLVGASESIFINDKGEARIEFQNDKKGKLEQVVMYGSISRRAYPLKKIVPYFAEKSEIELIVGEYFSEELNLSYRVQYVENQLKAFNRRGKTMTLDFLDKDRFLTEHRFLPLLEIHRDSNGSFRNFSISLGHSKNIMFTRVKESD